MSVVPLAPNVFTSFRVVTQSYVYTVPGESTISAAAGSVAYAGPPTTAPAALPTPPAITAPAAAILPTNALPSAAAAAPPTTPPVAAPPATTSPVAGSGVLGLGNILNAAVQVTATVPLLNAGATVCLGILVDGVCQSTTPIPPAAPATTAPGVSSTQIATTPVAPENGLLGLGTVLGAAIQATASAPIVNAAATVCLGILVNGVCQTTTPTPPVAAGPSTSAAAAATTPPVGGGLLGLGNIASAVVQATASVPIVNAAATVCLGVLVNGVCQSTTTPVGATPATTAGAGTGGVEGLLGGLATLPGAVLSASVGVAATPGSVLGLILPTVAATAAVCLGILTDGVCYTSDPAATPQATADPGLLGLPGIDVSASLCLGIFQSGLCLSAPNAAVSTLVPLAITSGGGVINALPTALPAAAVAAITSAATAVASQATAIVSIPEVSIIESALSSAAGLVTAGLADPTAVATLLNQVASGIPGVVTAAASISDPAVSNAIGAVTSILNGVVPGTGVLASLTSAVGGLISGLPSVAGGLVGGVTSAASGLTGNVNSASGGLVGGVLSPAGNVVSGVLSGNSGLVSGIIGDPALLSGTTFIGLPTAISTITFPNSVYTSMTVMTIAYTGTDPSASTLTFASGTVAFAAAASVVSSALSAATGTRFGSTSTITATTTSSDFILGPASASFASVGPLTPSVGVITPISTSPVSTFGSVSPISSIPTAISGLTSPFSGLVSSQIGVTSAATLAGSGLTGASTPTSVTGATGLVSSPHSTASSSIIPSVFNPGAASRISASLSSVLATGVSPPLSAPSSAATSSVLNPSAAFRLSASISSGVSAGASSASSGRPSFPTSSVFDPGAASKLAASASSMMATGGTSSLLSAVSSVATGGTIPSPLAPFFSAVSSAGAFISISSSGTLNIVANNIGPVASGAGLSLPTAAGSVIPGASVSPSSSFGSYVYSPTISTLIRALPAAGGAAIGSGASISNSSLPTGVVPFLGHASPSRAASYPAMVFVVVAALLMF
ncbi:hypothetical protein K461DRAFT_54436 [Myriangium duriaei CBS 260.36]|uniref:Uncharacterized protein n=1 Tax=Myriangium duriaei CBS 260.36 TaxID=1168546 RepID=A0A9P4IRV1_9PEZI|nr:hypothetical protein K461DRAFT_54436 [Myriangium duriaei CBS 260.36]